MIGHLYVTKEGSDVSGDGKSWGTAFNTINRAVYELADSPGNVHIGLGNFREKVTLAHEGQRLRGTTSRFIYGTVIEAPDATSDILTVKAMSCGASDIQFMGRQGTPWDATALLIDHAGYCQFDRLSFRQGTGAASATTGGVGIHIIESEGCKFSTLGISEFRRGLYLDSGATEHMFIDTMCSVNWEDLLLADDASNNTPGGNQFHRFKSVYCKSDRPVWIKAGGGNLFLDPDWNESPVIGNRIEIAGGGSNVFLRGACSPESEWIVSSDYNHFIDFTILRRLVLAGRGNVLDIPDLIGQELRIDGPDNVVRYPQYHAGVVNITGQGTVIEGAPEGMPINGTYRRPVMESVTAGGTPPPPDDGGGGGTPPPPTTGALLPAPSLLPDPGLLPRA